MSHSIQLKIVPQADHLYAVLGGPFDLSQILVAFREIFAANYAHGLRRILIDAKALEGEISLMDRFEMGRVGAELQREPVRVALIASEHHIWPDRFGETVANNRGLATKVTTSEAEALEWLHSSTTSTSKLARVGEARQ